MYQLVITFIFVSILLMSSYIIDNSKKVLSQINTTRYPKNISISMNSLWCFQWQIIDNRIMLLQSSPPYGYYRSMSNYEQVDYKSPYVSRLPNYEPVTVGRPYSSDVAAFVLCETSWRCFLSLWVSSSSDWDKVSVWCLMFEVWSLMKIGIRDTCLLVGKEIINVLIHISIHALFNWQIFLIAIKLIGVINWMNEEKRRKLSSCRISHLDGIWMRETSKGKNKEKERQTERGKKRGFEHLKKFQWLDFSQMSSHLKSFPFIECLKFLTLRIFKWHVTEYERIFHTHSDGIGSREKEWEREKKVEGEKKKIKFCSFIAICIGKWIEGKCVTEFHVSSDWNSVFFEILKVLKRRKRKVSHEGERNVIRFTGRI